MSQHNLLTHSVIFNRFGLAVLFQWSELGSFHLHRVYQRVARHEKYGEHQNEEEHGKNVDKERAPIGGVGVEPAVTMLESAVR